MANIQYFIKTANYWQSFEEKSNIKSPKWRMEESSTEHIISIYPYHKILHYRHNPPPKKSKTKKKRKLLTKFKANALESWNLITLMIDEWIEVQDLFEIEPPPHHYRPFSKVTVNPLLEHVSGLLEEECPLVEGHRLTIKAGCLGVGRVAFSLPSMKTTLDMVGRSFGSSCTHKSPTFTHFKYSSVLQLLRSVCSIKSSAFSSFHKCHAWDQFKIWKFMK